MSNVISVNPTQAKSLVIDCINAEVFPLLKGSPGTSKSSIMHEIAKEKNLKLIDVRLAQIDDVELNGFPDLSGEKATYKPFDIFPIASDDVPVGYDGWLIFFDELTSADKTKQGAAYKIILDRMVGQEKLHDKAYCVGAGNLTTDKAVVNNMSTALQSRMVHLNIAVDKDQWLDWAGTAGIDSRIISFIEWKPSMLYKFDPNHQDETFACPRTWEFASKLLGAIPNGKFTAEKLPLIAGTLSQGVARELQVFCNLFSELTPFEDIIKDPENAKLPEQSGHLYATVSMLVDHIDAENAETVFPYIMRMGPEFQLSCIKRAYSKNKKLAAIPKIRDWIISMGREFL